MTKTYALRVDGKTLEVFAPAFYDVDVFAPHPIEGEPDVLVHKVGDLIAIEDRFHPDMVALLVEVDPNNLPADEVPAAPEVTAEQVRAERAQRLAATDWTQLRDVPEATATAWAKHRQALRDVPAQAGFPGKVKWPKDPA